MENYLQQTGRAGRDGNPANCILFYHLGDLARIKKLIQWDKNKGKISEEIKAKLIKEAEIMT